MAADKKFVCHVDVKCSNARPENTIWNDEKSLAVRWVVRGWFLKVHFLNPSF